VIYLSMENAKHTGIPEWMGGTCLSLDDHNITVCSRVHGILITADIVGRKVDPKDFRGVNVVVDDANGI
jgi:hypothetical protein